jgi:hypothetical protein
MAEFNKITSRQRVLQRNFVITLICGIVRSSVILLLPLFIRYKIKFHCLSVTSIYCENRNDPDLVQAFLKKFKAPNLPLSLRFKGFGCHYNSI